MPELPHSFLGRVTVGYTKNQVCCFLGLAGCDQNHAMILLERLQPACQVGSTVGDGSILDAAVAAEKCCAHLSDKLLTTVDLVTKAFEIGQRGSVEPPWMTSRVNQFMEQRAVVLLSSIEAGPVRHCHNIQHLVVAGNVSAVIDGWLCRPARHDLFARLDWVDLRRIYWRLSGLGAETITLLRVEDRVIAAQDGPLLDGRFTILYLFNAELPKHNRTSSLPFAYVSTKPLCLAEG